MKKSIYRQKVNMAGEQYRNDPFAILLLNLNSIRGPRHTAHLFKIHPHE